MKAYVSLGLFILFSLLLLSCSSKYPLNGIDYTQESWQGQIVRSPSQWTRGADSWFLNGEPTQAELAARHASYSASISTTAVRVPDFTKVKVNGDFQVQIFGTDDHNSVYVYGPNAGAHEVSVEVRGDTLWVNQVNKMPIGLMKQVIVRIGMHQIHELTSSGCALVEGVRLRSTHLNVTSFGSGNIYLAGNLNLQCITQMGSGSVTIFGVNTTALDIRTQGASGCVNLFGYVGVKSISHRGGATDINIIGAVPCNPLNIYADGAGRISISGIVNLQDVRAKGATCVYISKTQSDHIYVCLEQDAKVGVAGCTNKVAIDAFNTSRFSGKSLCAQTALVRAHDQAHVNVAASNSVFATASEASSVYFFGSGAALTKFTKDYGTVIVLSNGVSYCACAAPPVRRYVGAG